MGRKVLPEDLRRRVVMLKCKSVHGGRCDVYLVGVTHCSEDSCREVRAIIKYLKPQVVFLELCQARAAMLKSPKDSKVPTLGEMIRAWSKKRSNLMEFLCRCFFAKVTSKLQVFPWAEFGVAFEEALSNGAQVKLGDRPISITMRRTWGNMPLLHKAKFLWGIFLNTAFLPSSEQLNKCLKELDDIDTDTLTLMTQKWSENFPSMVEPFVYERDRYMSFTLLRIARNNSSVVAIVGKGHLEGIAKHWEQPIELWPLLQIPNSSWLSGMKKLALVGVLAAVTGIFVLFS